VEIETVPIALAFAAGIASFLSPCHLAVVPAYLGVLGGAAISVAPASQWRLLSRAGFFVLGFSLVMVVLGMSIGLIGYMIWDQMILIRKVGGVLLLVFGLHMLGLIRIPLLYREFRVSADVAPRQGAWGALAMGTVFGFGWTPCVGPVLAAILLLAAESATVWHGGVLLAVYAAGLSIPFLAVALLLNRTPRLVRSLRKSSRLVEVATGVMLLAMGVLLYTNQFQRVASLFGTWSPL
jgi:cytochrome c-type biogenesis protein